MMLCTTGSVKGALPILILSPIPFLAAHLLSPLNVLFLIALSPCSKKHDEIGFSEGKSLQLERGKCFWSTRAKGRWDSIAKQPFDRFYIGSLISRTSFFMVAGSWSFSVSFSHSMLDKTFFVSGLAWMAIHIYCDIHYRRRARAIYISDFVSERGKFKWPEAKNGSHGERRALRVHVALPL